MVSERRSGNYKAALGFRNFSADFPRRFDPLANHDLYCADCGVVCGTVSHTAWKLWHFSNEGSVFIAPVNDDFIARISFHFRVQQVYT